MEVRTTVRARIAASAALVASLLALTSGLLQAPVQAVASHAPQPSHTPNTLKVFNSQGNGRGQTTPQSPTIAPRSTGPMKGISTAKAPQGAGALHIPALTIPLDAHYLSTSPVTKQASGAWFTNSDKSVAVYLANQSVDITTATVPATAGISAPAATGVTGVTTGVSSAATANGPFTLQIAQSQGTYRGDSMTLAGFTVSVLDGKGHAVSNARLTSAIQIRFHYGAEDLADVNASDLRLVWPQTADPKKGVQPVSVPLTVDAKAQTLTATITKLHVGPLLLGGPIGDANPASSEHPTVAANTGDLQLPIPLQIPPAAGGLQPNLTLTYSSASTNERDRDATGPAMGEGWDLSLGSISYDASNGFFYLNGVGGVNDILLCCVTAGSGNTNYFMPHHDNTLQITTIDNSKTPNTTGSSFKVLTKDGTEYDFGATTDSLRTTVTFSGGSYHTTYYQWDLNKVIRHAGSSGVLQEYTIAYWQDKSSNNGIVYVRDALPRLIYYNYVNGTGTDEIYFNAHWPQATTTSGPATATQYGGAYYSSCSGTPLISPLTLRCDDPVQPSNYEAPPLTMSTTTLDSVVVATKVNSAWQPVREYDLSYAPDLVANSCTDDMTGQSYACAGEHLLSSVQEIPYQNGTEMPSRQPITFTYTNRIRVEYHDYTENGFDGNPFDAQRTWNYLSGYTDEQTGAGETIQWEVAYGNSQGVPSGKGLTVTDPWACNTPNANCIKDDDRQWPRQSVESIKDGATNLTTNYTYALNTPCGSSCTEDTWIAPTGWGACSHVAQAPGAAMASCLISSPFTGYYNELFTGFAQVQISNPDGTTNLTQYYAGDGWGTDDFQFPNEYHGYPVVEQTYQGAATVGATPLKEVDHAYVESSCPAFSSGQLVVNDIEMCRSYETQRDTYIGGSNTTAGVPHLTQTWTYADYTDSTHPPATGMGYQSLMSSSETTNDDLSDNFTNYGSTQPTYTTNYTYVQNDGAQDNMQNVYLANLPAQVTLDDSAGNRWNCTQTYYDGNSYLTGQSSSVTDGLATQSDTWTNCGTSSNGYTPSGLRRTAAGYDSYGQPIVTTDADAMAGDTTHVDCAAPVTPLVVDGHASGLGSYTTCTGYDTTQKVYPTAAWNALNQETTATYDLAQGVETSSTDANNVTTNYGGPVYEYNGLPPILANYQDMYTQTTLPGETLGGASPWTTRAFVYSFCAAATGTKPCLEVDTVRNYDSSDTLVSRVFYDRDGRQVETRTTGAIPGQDSVTITAYNDTADTTWSSLACYVPTLTTSNGGRASYNTANYIAPTQTSTGSGAYVDPSTVSGSCASGTLTGTTTYTDALGRSIATDDPIGTGVGASGTGCLVSGSTYHHTTCVNYTPAVASSVNGLPSTDSEPYLQTLSIDANLHQSATYTDALGLTAYALTLSGSSQTPFGSGITSYGVTSYLYDPKGELRQATDPLGHVMKMGYDATGKERSLIDPNRGSESYTYDSNGNATTTVDARGASGTTYAGYDPLNRQLWRNTTNIPTGAYVTNTYGTTASNYSIGRLASETFSNSNTGGSLSGSYAYTYDQRGRVTATTETIGISPYTTNATYNDDNQLVTQTYPDGDVLTTNYTPNAGVESALGLTPHGGSQVWLLSNLVYSGTPGAAALLSSATLGAITGGTSSVSYSYDGLLRPTDTKYTYTPTGGSAQTLYEIQPSYDAIGNVAGLTTTLPQGVDTQAFCYDEQNRLTWAATTGAPPCDTGIVLTGDSGSLATGGANYTATYSYDAANRITSSPLGGYTYGSSAHVDAATAIVIQGWTAAYDAAGNMTCRAITNATTCSGSPTGNALSYDNEGNLASWQNTPSSPATTNTFLYDGSGNRVEQVSATSAGTTTTTKYIGSREELTTIAPPHGANQEVDTIYYNGVALSVGGVLSTLSYMLTDKLGSLTAAVNTSGVVTASQLYNPYGSVRYSNGTLPGTKAYTGQRADATTGLDYYGARYYDPLVGQFASADTMLTPQKNAAPTVAQLNRYAYVSGNPETQVDPTGHRPTCPPDGCTYGPPTDPTGNGSEPIDKNRGAHGRCDPSNPSDCESGSNSARLQNAIEAIVRPLRDEVENIQEQILEIIKQLGTQNWDSDQGNITSGSAPISMLFNPLLNDLQGVILDAQHKIDDLVGSSPENLSQWEGSEVQALTAVRNEAATEIQEIHSIENAYASATGSDPRVPTING
jgi:RHS repeat-associated protein